MSKLPVLLLLCLTTVLLAADSKLKLPDRLNPDKQHPTIDSTPFKRTGPTIQLAILLDSSNSMDGLIRQTKTQIWKIINELALANKDQKNVTLQVALFEFGKNTLPKSKHYLQMLSPLTNDLDFLSEQLFGLKTRGGDEYAGWVIQTAVQRLQWSTHPDDLRLIIIAGNESFAQGSLAYSQAIRQAVKQNIVVNTIFCGDRQSGISLQWQQGAHQGGGVYMNIDQNQKVRMIDTPYDNEIVQLGQKLNQTYIAYGYQGIKKKQRQAEQDRNAASMSKPAAVERSFAKSSAQYQTKSWDLASAYESKPEILDSLSQDAMPKQLQGKNDKEIRAYLDKQLEQRKTIQTELTSLRKKRTTYIAKHQTKKQQDIGTVLVNNLKKIATQNGFDFSNNKK